MVRAVVTKPESVRAAREAATADCALEFSELHHSSERPATVKLAEIIYDNLPVEFLERSHRLVPPIRVPSPEDLIQEPALGRELIAQILDRTSDKNENIEDRRNLETVIEAIGYIEKNASPAQNTVESKNQTLKIVALLGRSLFRVIGSIPLPAPDIETDFEERAKRAKGLAATNTLLTALTNQATQEIEIENPRWMRATFESIKKGTLYFGSLALAGLALTTGAVWSAGSALLAGSLVALSGLYYHLPNLIGRTLYRLQGKDPDDFTTKLRDAKEKFKDSLRSTSDKAVDSLAAVSSAIGHKIHGFITSLQDKLGRVMAFVETIRKLRYVSIVSNDPLLEGQPQVSKVEIPTGPRGDAVELATLIKSSKSQGGFDAAPLLLRSLRFSQPFHNADPGPGETYYTQKVVPGKNLISLPPGYDITGIRAIDRKERHYLPRGGIEANWSVLGGATVRIPLGVSRITYRVQQSRNSDSKETQEALRKIIPEQTIFLGIEGEALREGLQHFTPPLSATRELVSRHINARGFSLTNSKFIQRFISNAGDAAYEAIGGLRCGTKEQVNNYLAKALHEFGIPAVVVSASGWEVAGRILDKQSKNTRVFSVDDTGIQLNDLTCKSLDSDFLPETQIRSAERQDILEGLSTLSFQEVFALGSETLEAILAPEERVSLLEKLRIRRSGKPNNSFACWYQSSHSMPSSKVNLSPKARELLPLIGALATRRAYAEHAQNALSSKKLGPLLNLERNAPTPPMLPEKTLSTLSPKVLKLLELEPRALFLNSVGSIVTDLTAAPEERSKGRKWITEHGLSRESVVQLLAGHEHYLKPSSRDSLVQNTLVGLEVKASMLLSPKEYGNLFEYDVVRCFDHKETVELLFGMLGTLVFEDLVGYAHHNPLKSKGDITSQLENTLTACENLRLKKGSLDGQSQTAAYAMLALISKKCVELWGDNQEERRAAIELTDKIADIIEELGPNKRATRGLSLLYDINHGPWQEIRTAAIAAASEVGKEYLGILDDYDEQTLSEAIGTKIATDDLLKPHSFMVEALEVKRAEAMGLAPGKFGASAIILKKAATLLGLESGKNDLRFNLPNAAHPGSQIYYDLCSNNSYGPNNAWANLYRNLDKLCKSAFVERIPFEKLWPPQDEYEVLKTVIKKLDSSLVSKLDPSLSKTLYSDLLKEMPDALAYARLHSCISGKKFSHEDNLIAIRERFPDLWQEILDLFSASDKATDTKWAIQACRLHQTLALSSEADRYKVGVWLGALAQAGYKDKILELGHALLDALKNDPETTSEKLLEIFNNDNLPKLHEFAPHLGSISDTSCLLALSLLASDTGREILSCAGSWERDLWGWALSRSIKTDKTPTIGSYWQDLFERVPSTRRYMWEIAEVAKLGKKKAAALQSNFADTLPRYLFARTGQALVKSPTGELFELTQFKEGDDPRRIDARSSNRKGRLLVRRNEDIEVRDLQIVADLKTLEEDLRKWNRTANNLSEYDRSLNASSVWTSYKEAIPHEIVELLATLELAAKNNINVSVELVWRAHVGTLENVVKKAPGSSHGVFDAVAFLVQLDNYLGKAHQLQYREEHCGLNFNSGHAVFEPGPLPNKRGAISLFNFPSNYAVDLDAAISSIRRQGGLAGVMPPVKEVA